jgi:hypothetical protein
MATGIDDADTLHSALRAVEVGFDLPHVNQLAVECPLTESPVWSHNAVASCRRLVLRWAAHPKLSAASQRQYQVQCIPAFEVVVCCCLLIRPIHITLVSISGFSCLRLIVKVQAWLWL